MNCSSCMCYQILPRTLVFNILFGIFFFPIINQKLISRSGFKVQNDPPIYIKNALNTNPNLDSRHKYKQ